jgi:protein TonB
VKNLSPPKPSPVPPPPQAPVVDVPEPRANDIVTPPSPPSPPAPPSTIEASVDISSKNMNPPRYPPAAFRAGIQGEVILIIDVDANGNVTNVSVERSSRNRDLDRAAMEAARKWSFRSAESGGKKVAGRVRVPVNFALN